MCMRTYASSRVKRKSFYGKSELQMFLLISIHQYGVSIQSSTKVMKSEWNVSANKSGTVGHKDLRLGKIVFILVFYNISFSWLLPVDSFQFIFLLRDSENDVHCRRVYLPKLSSPVFSFGCSIYHTSVILAI